jgi:hypothetical protein
MKYITIFTFCTLFGILSSHAQLNLEDLSANFTKGYTYGTVCGIASIPPVLRKDIEVFIKNKDVEAIDNWLNSPSLVHQVYAAEALIRLDHQMIAISKKQKNQIRDIKSLETIISSCKGCMRGDITIEEALADYELR